MNTQLLLATANDLPLIETYVREYHAFEGLPLRKTTLAATLQPLLGESELGRIWLIQHDGAPVGYVVLCFGYSIEFGGRDEFIDELYIGQSHRGEGIGTAALKLLREQARTLGIRALHLKVARSNERAQRLYGAAGCSTRERYWLMSWIDDADVR